MINKKKAACFIPVKAKSKRVVGKNLRSLNDKRLFEWMIDTVVASDIFDEIFVDTDSSAVAHYCSAFPVTVIEREPELASDSANGNDLLNYWHEKYPNFDYYFQAFVTSPFTALETIRECVDILKTTTEFDSIFTAYEECGWYWFENKPINYDPAVLPRSQDAKKVFSESTALYGITASALKKNSCRIGSAPYHYFVSDMEAIDIDSEFDFMIAEIIAKEYYYA